MDPPPDGGAPRDDVGGGGPEDGVVYTGEDEIIQQGEMMGVGGEEDGVEDEEDDMDVAGIIRDFGGHDLMKGVQKTLFEQLEREHERVAIEVRESENEMNMVKTNRESAPYFCRSQANIKLVTRFRPVKAR